MRRRAIAWAVVLSCLGGLAGCQQRLPTAPDELDIGIVVYEHANYLGASAHITSDVRDLRDVRGPCEHTESSGTGTTTTVFDWNDCISSVRVAPGWRATLYRDDDFRDDSVELTEDHSNLQLLRQHDCPNEGLNDCVTSIRVRRR